MSILLRSNLILSRKSVFIQINNTYAKKADALSGKSKGGAPTGKKRLPVETDPVKLTTYCCGLNFNKTGEEIKLKPKEEYPDWLWTLRLGNKPTLNEMDPNTLEYWERAAELHEQRKKRLLGVKKLERKVVNHTEKLAELKDLRFRALAGYHYNIGE